jgi:hypothetical protein
MPALQEMLLRAFFVIATLGSAAAQTQPMSVCQMLDSAADHQEVVARVKIAGSHHHGFWLTEGPNVDPCPGWRKRFFTAPSALIPIVSSRFGVHLTPEEERAGRDFLNRLFDLSRRDTRATNDLTVTLKGVFVRKAWPWIFRGRSGDWVGNGFGPSGGCAAVFVIKEILSGL